MTPITWFFCLAPLCIVAVHAQMGAVQPLVMAVHVQEDRRKDLTTLHSTLKYNTRRITLTDGNNENFDTLKLLFSNTQPTYIAILCGGTEGDSTNRTFIVKQVIDRIDSMDLNLTCKHVLRPNVKMTNHYSWGITEYEIGLEFKVPEEMWPEKQEAPDTGSSTLLHKFMNEFDIKSQTDYGTVEYLEIRYNYDLNVPQSITHTVTAHMHSDTHEEECEEIDIPKNTIEHEQRTYDKLVAQFKPKDDHSDHQWRQLVPMQDFKGIYTPKPTCIYLNYVLLHENAMNSLKEIEIFIQKVADVINAVDVVSEIHIERNDASVTYTDQNDNTIPTLVLKKITYTLKDTMYGVVVVIHNKEINKFCEYEKEWGWPEHNVKGEKMRIGSIYYCSMKSDIIYPIQPFNLKKIKPDQITSISDIIQTNEYSRHTEDESPE